MNTDQQAADAKLRQSKIDADNNLKTAAVKNANPKMSAEYSWYEGAKSEAAKEYCQSLRSQQSVEKVDVEGLAASIFTLIPRVCHDNLYAQQVCKRIIEELLPHLRPAKEEDNAVQFGFYLITNYKQLWDRNNHQYKYIPITSGGILINGNEKYFQERCDKHGKIIELVYTEFKITTNAKN